MNIGIIYMLFKKCLIQKPGRQYQNLEIGSDYYIFNIWFG